MSWYPGPAWLEVPVELPNGYLRALPLADAVVVDLTGHPASADRRLARRLVRKLAMHDLLDRERTVIRIGPRSSPEYDADLMVLRDVGVTTVLLSCPANLHDLEDLPGFSVVAPIDSIGGVEQIDAIVEARNCVGIVWSGPSVYSSMCGGFPPPAASGRFRGILRNIEARIHLSAHSHGQFVLQRIHAPTSHLRDEYLAAARIGFDGLIETDSGRLSLVRKCFLPSDKELARARSVVRTAMLSDTFEVSTGSESELHAAERIIVRSAKHRANARMWS